MHNTRKVKIGNVTIGGGCPVAVQSMCNTDTRNVDATVGQILRLEDAGCQITRVAVSDMDGVRALSKIKEKISIPIVADIQFDYRLAVESAMAGADKIRINPGNIGSEAGVKKVADICREKNIPIRIGVNTGSIDKNILEKYGQASPEAMVASVKQSIQELNRFDFDNIVVALKSSNVKKTVQAYTLMSRECDYPLHVGVTEAGDGWSGAIKSSVGIGYLLLNSIGDTIRVSLTDDPVKEVEAGYEILRACGLYEGGVEIISCPTCSRCHYDLMKLSGEIKERTKHIKRPLKIAIMGCAVNGPGEAKDADIGVAGGNGEGLIFVKGEIIKKVAEAQLADSLMNEIETMI